MMFDAKEMLANKHSGFPVGSGVYIAAHDRRALVCPLCGGQMRIIAFITHSADIRHILNRIGVDCAPPRSVAARGPPRDACDAPVGAGVQGEPDQATDRDRAARPAPDHEVDQRVNWEGSEAALPTGCGSMLRARLPPCDFATQSLAVQVVRQIGEQALVGALTHPTRVILRLERLKFLSVRDFVEAQWLMLQQDLPDDFVIATGVQHNVRDFVNAPAVELGMKLVWRGSGVDEKCV